MTCPVTRIDRAAYDAIDAVNWSTAQYAVQSGLAYRHTLDSADPTETDAMRLGRATHTAVFEPDLFTSEYVIWEGGIRSGGEWKQFKAANLTRTILLPSEADAALNIRDAVRAHPVAAALLREGTPECTLTWTEPATGIACKQRMDWLTDADLVDLKTAKDIEISAFGRQAAGLLYHAKMAFYQMGLAANGLERAVKIIAVESKAPHDVAVIELDDDVLYAGQVLVYKALQTIARCRAARCWPGRYPTPVALVLPGYAYLSEDETEAIMREVPLV